MAAACKLVHFGVGVGLAWDIADTLFSTPARAFADTLLGMVGLVNLCTSGLGLVPDNTM